MAGPLDSMMTDQVEQQLWQALRDVIEPDLGENIVDLGLVRSMRVGDNGAVAIDIIMTTSYSPHAVTLADDVRRAALRAGAARAEVRLVSEPAWTPYQMAESLRVLLGLPDSEPQLTKTATSWRDKVRRRLFRA